jgi:release factor glutamine methyltransferase
MSPAAYPANVSSSTAKRGIAPAPTQQHTHLGSRERSDLPGPDPATQKNQGLKQFERETNHLAELFNPFLLIPNSPHLIQEPQPTSMTLREALTAAIAKLQAIPQLHPEASEDATHLLLHALTISRATLLTTYNRPLTPEEQRAFTTAIARRLTHEPVQYITGEREFYGLPLRVTPAVLIPRNLTEHLVEAVLEDLRPKESHAQRNQPLRIADIGTGSGAIAIALAVHLPHAHITALDLSPQALAVAAANADLNQVADRIHFVHSDLLEAIAHEPPFDAIVSNPPYIPTTDRDTLHPQVLDYEPATALFAGPTGLDLYGRLIPQAHAALKPNGLLALEFGPDQNDAIAALLTRWRTHHFVNDLFHSPRIAIARK